MTDERLIALKDRAADEFFKNPNVTAVGIGARERDGRRTGELVIKVYVREKRRPQELTPGEMLPPQFEGIGVDVGVLGDVKREKGSPLPPEAPMGSGQTTADKTDDTRNDPLMGGARIQVDLPKKGHGTGGSIWRDVPPADQPDAPPKKVWLMTNFHVIEVPQPDPRHPVPPATLRPPAGTRVGHPSSLDSPSKGTNHLIGAFNGLGDTDADRDAALIELDPHTRYRAEIKCIGVISKDTYTVTDTDLLQPKPFQVRKYGTRTRLTGGTVEALHLDRTVETIRHRNLMMIVPNANPEVGKLFFTDEGDSGAAIVNDSNQIVALHAIGGDATPTLHRSLAYPIADVVAAFKRVSTIDIQPVTATAVDVVQEVPAVTPFAPPRGLDRVLTGAAPHQVEALARVDADLVASRAGRSLRALWVDHQTELLDLMGDRRRVSLAWRRGGGPVILHTLIRMAADPSLAMPAAINGVPPMERLANIHAVLHANASPELRRALDRALAAVPDPASLTYDQLLATIATR